MFNPWAYYQINKPENIPDLNPHSDDEARGCFAGACGFIISSIIYALIISFSFNLRERNYIGSYSLCAIIAIISMVVYPILTIMLMRFSFVIADYVNKKMKK